MERRLDALAGRWRLTDAQRDRLARILRVLDGDGQAPSAVRDARRALEVHIADSLAALDVRPLRGAARIADLGSGAGFPGLPVAVAFPASRVSLVESSARKCAFLRRALRAVPIENAEVVHARVEQWAAGLGMCDAVLARALAPQPVVLEYAAPLLRPGGVLLDWRGALGPREERVSELAADVLGLRRAGAHALPGRADAEADDAPGCAAAAGDRRRTACARRAASRSTASVPAVSGPAVSGPGRSAVRRSSGAARSLYVYLKVRDTPERFPRRPGVARKRPLGLGRVARGAASDRDAR